MATGAGKRAIRISEVTAGGPAAQAGLLAGDLVLSVDGVAIEGADDLIRLLNAERIGRETVVSILRGGAVEQEDGGAGGALSFSSPPLGGEDG